ncbi:secreted RxLR effector protein 161-like [Nicotiana tabacum]|uniref:Secreted RxLR effector protein 161-like n=1 Tax=Nicotiana tabacum TaxID=4097 RepID=A0AC58TGZ4_TOBAC
MHQRKYTIELISELGLGATKPAVTPIEANVKLTTKEYDEHTVILYGTTEETLTDPSNGQTLSQFMQKPKRSHMEAAQRVVRYVKGQPGQGILLSSRKNNTTTTYCDADWAAFPLTRKSVTGYFIKYSDSLVSWKSKKQSTISRSSAESEYMSIASIVAELVWIFGLFKDIGVDIELPMNILIDSKALI